MTRREFNALSAGTLLSSLSSAEKVAAATMDPSDSPVALPWYMTIKRIGQTNFNEHDGDSQNVELWADFWASERSFGSGCAAKGVYEDQCGVIPLRPANHSNQPIL